MRSLIVALLFMMNHMTLTGNEDINLYGKYIDEIQVEFIKQMEKEFQLSCSGTGQCMPKKLEGICVSFDAYREGTLEEARKIEIIGTEKLLKLINDHEKIRPFLSHYPMTHEGADVSIGFIKKSYKLFPYGTVAFVCQGKGKIHYHARDAKVDYLVKLKEETYEEAYEIVKQQNLLP
jgi:hypothetical protein